MNALNDNIQSMVTTTNQENMNVGEESEMKTTNNTSKWHLIDTPVKLIVLGLAAGAMMMTVVALPSSERKRPLVLAECPILQCGSN